MFVTVWSIWAGNRQLVMEAILFARYQLTWSYFPIKMDNVVRFSFVRFASQLVTEGVSLLRWLVILIICVFIGKRAIQLGHWARYSDILHTGWTKKRGI